MEAVFVTVEVVCAVPVLQTVFDIIERELKSYLDW